MHIQYPSCSTGALAHIAHAALIILRLHDFCIPPIVIDCQLYVLTWCSGIAQVNTNHGCIRMFDRVADSFPGDPKCFILGSRSNGNWYADHFKETLPIPCLTLALNFHVKQHRQPYRIVNAYRM